MNVTDIFLRNNRGVARYFRKESYPVFLKGNVVLIKVNGKLRRLGFFREATGKIRGDREYELVGLITTPDYTFHVVKRDDGSLWAF